jgi:CAAX protease family protein
MPGWLDVALVLLFAAVWPLAEYFYLWPRHVRAVERGEPQARTLAYTRTMFEEWTLAALALAITLAARRPVDTLGLRPPEDWRFWAGLSLSLVYGVLILVQGTALARKPDSLARLRTRVEPLRPLLPHTPAEFRRFVPLSFTAGICEELLYRGYLVWVLQSWIGLWPAAIVSMVLFGLGHSYQGFKFGVRAFLAGVFMGLLALATGSILPGMLLHALIDLGSGWVTHMAVRSEATPEPAAAGAA